MVNVQLTAEELHLIIIGMTNAQYAFDQQKKAFELVQKLRDKLREATT